MRESEAMDGCHSADDAIRAPFRVETGASWAVASKIPKTGEGKSP